MSTLLNYFSPSPGGLSGNSSYQIGGIVLLIPRGKRISPAIDID